MPATDLRAPGHSTEAPGSPSNTNDRLRTLVTVSRTHESDAQQRQVLARVDDGPTATLMFGDEVTMELAPGRHVLRANNTLIWKRVTFTIESGEHLAFQLVNRPGRLTLGFLALLGVAPLYLTIERRSLM